MELCYVTEEGMMNGQSTAPFLMKPALTHHKQMRHFSI